MNAQAETLDRALKSHQAGQLGEAEQLYRQVLRVDPGHADAWHLLGVLAFQTGHHDQATEMIGNAIKVNGGNHLYHSNIGAALQAAGRIENAIESCRRAVQLAPNYAAAHYNLARALQAAGDWAAAEAEYRRTIELDPQQTEALLNLGNMLFDRGDLDAAVTMFRASVRTRPDFAYAHYNLGNALFDLGQIDEAKICFQTTLRLKPDYAEAHNNLGAIYRGRDQLDEALNSFNEACKLKPEHAPAHNNRGSVLQSQGRVTEALSAYTQARKLVPHDSAAHSNALVAANNVAEFSPQELYEQHREWARLHTAQIPAMRIDRNADPQRRLRIGYCSPDFRAHPVSQFFLPLLKQHNRQAVEVTCYSNGQRSDGVTAEIRGLSDRWREVRRCHDQKLAALIATDEIDILVDLAGHTAGHRLPVFARRPAPIQISFLGYPHTTGMETIDYRFTDAIADPLDEPNLHSETLTHLPGPFCCYSPLQFDVEFPQLPADRNGVITFGSLHNLAKLNRHVLATWSEVLQAVPQSRLLIARTTLTPSCRERLLAEFRALGVEEKPFGITALADRGGEIPTGLSGHRRRVGHLPLVRPHHHL